MFFKRKQLLQNITSDYDVEDISSLKYLSNKKLEFLLDARKVIGALWGKDVSTVIQRKSNYDYPGYTFIVSIDCENQDLDEAMNNQRMFDYWQIGRCHPRAGYMDILVTIR